MNLKKHCFCWNLCDRLIRATVSKQSIVRLSLNNDEREFLLCVCLIWAVSILNSPPNLCVCVLSPMWHVFSPVLLGCAALSPRWGSSSVALWEVFDFTTCGETFHLLIFPGVWGCNRLCKHKLIHRQRHNRLQSFLIPLKSLWTTMKMNFLPDTRQGLLKKTKQPTYLLTLSSLFLTKFKTVSLLELYICLILTSSGLSCRAPQRWRFYRSYFNFPFRQRKHISLNSGER